MAESLGLDMDMQVSVMTGMAGAGASAKLLNSSAKSKRTAKVSLSGIKDEQKKKTEKKKGKISHLKFSLSS